MTDRFDAIVVGAGATGGLAAALLCEQGLSVLVLDAGTRYPFGRKPFSKTLSAAIGAVSDPRLAKVLPPRLIHAGTKVLRQAGRVRQPVQTECYAWVQKPDSLLDDRDHPYETPPDKPFTWIRALGVGGRLLVPGHGRQYYRFSAADLAAKPGTDSVWPFGIEELVHWYEQVERRLNLTGAREGIAQIPDSLVAREAAPDDAETALMETIRHAWPQAPAMLSRYAPPADFVGAALATGRLTLRSGALVRRVVAGSDGRAAGVEWVDTLSGQTEQSSGPLIFLCASSLESTRILLNSSTPRGALGDQLPALGRCLTDHIMLKAEGVMPSLPQGGSSEPGRCVYLPRFDARNGKARPRGFGVQLYASGNPAGSWVTAVGFGECVPRAENRVTVAPGKTDRWGIPQLRIEMDWSSDDRRLGEEMSGALWGLLDVLKAEILVRPDGPATPGTSVHECGGARLGTDAETSVLGPDNQCWAIPGLYVTDGASFPSQGIQNPTLTMMALTARACALVAS